MVFGGFSWLELVFGGSTGYRWFMVVLACYRCFSVVLMVIDGFGGFSWLELVFGGSTGYRCFLVV